MFNVEFTQDAIEDLQSLRKYEQQQIVDAADNQLKHEPDKETRNRKRLRPNQLAEWELRAGDCRVFYDVDAVGLEVKIVAVGVKAGNKLLIRGEEFEL
jgi:mRNA-degrading endonuclease RelE of RelBE toxin-antitoxin system